MRSTTNKELIERIEKEHLAFVDLATSIPKMRYREEGVWGDGWTIKDLLASHGVGADVPELVPERGSRTTTLRFPPQDSSGTRRLS